MKFRDLYWYLSNMYPTKVPMNIGGEDLIFDNAEAAFQAQKNPELAKLFVGLNGFDAKRKGRQIPITTPNWDTARLDAMRKAVEAKFNNNKDLLKQLQDTGVDYISEDNDWGDTFWGISGGKGQNNLGKILMDVRDAAVAAAPVTDTITDITPTTADDVVVDGLTDVAKVSAATDALQNIYDETSKYERLKDEYKQWITISNMKNTGGVPLAGQIPVDRRHSVLGNPFQMMSEDDRMDVLQKYYDYFTDVTSHNIPGQPYPEDKLSPETVEAMQSMNTPYWIDKRGGTVVTGQSMMDELRRMTHVARAQNGLDLTDWCAPKPCHAETIGNFIGQYADKLFKKK